MFQPLDQIPPPTVPTTIQNKVKPMAISHLPPPWGLHSIPNVYFEQTSHSNVWACLLIASQRRPKHTFNQLFPWQGLCSCYQALHQLMISLIRVSITTGSQNKESVTVLMIISTDHTIMSIIIKKKKSCSLRFCRYSVGRCEQECCHVMWHSLSRSVRLLYSGLILDSTHWMTMKTRIQHFMFFFFYKYHREHPCLLSIKQSQSAVQ